MISKERVLQADALVNTTGNSCDLSSGAMAKAFLQAAGQGIQDECSNVSIWRIVYAVIETSSESDSCSLYWYMYKLYVLVLHVE